MIKRSLFPALGSLLGLGMTGLGGYGVLSGWHTAKKGLKDVASGEQLSGAKQLSGGLLRSALNAALFNEMLLTSLATKALGLGVKSREALQTYSAIHEAQAALKARSAALAALKAGKSAVVPGITPAMQAAAKTALIPIVTLGQRARALGTAGLELGGDMGGYAASDYLAGERPQATVGQGDVS